MADERQNLEIARLRKCVHLYLCMYVCMYVYTYVSHQLPRLTCARCRSGLAPSRIAQRLPLTHSLTQPHYTPWNCNNWLHRSNCHRQASSQAGKQHKQCSIVDRCLYVCVCVYAHLVGAFSELRPTFYNYHIADLVSSGSSTITLSTALTHSAMRLHSTHKASYDRVKCWLLLLLFAFFVFWFFLFCGDSAWWRSSCHFL